MKKVFTLLITCFLFFKSYALSGDKKASSVETHTKTRITYRDMIIDASYFADDFTAYVCEGFSRTFTVTGGTNFQWYKDDVAIPGATSNQYTVTEAGKYRANNSNTVTVIISKKPAKPTITFID